MPSPFPGMDPFLEGQKWSDFHHGVIEEIRAALIPQVRPRYVVEVAEHIYVDYGSDEQAELIRPDTMVLEAEQRQPHASGGTATATAVAVAPVLLTVEIPERRRIAFLTVREREERSLVTVIEVLSPLNKRRGSDGRRKYLRKRAAVLESAAHLIELDLLRRGARLPTKEPLPSGDYYALVSRERERPVVEVYAWPLRHILPPIPVPLVENDPEATLDLQAVFNTVYDRAGYDYSLNYRRPVEPPLSEADATWIQEQLAAWLASR
jgi:uncharacterized protein DUF4058